MEKDSRRMMRTVLHPSCRIFEELGLALLRTWTRVHGPILSVLTVVMRGEPLLDVLAHLHVGHGPIDNLLLRLGHGKKNLGSDAKISPPS